MSNWVPISKSEHSNKKWRPIRNFEFAQGLQTVEALYGEIRHLVPHFVLGFIRGDDSSYRFVALLGLGGTQNLYTNLEGQWMAGYIPSILRAHPFSLSEGSKEEEKILCIKDTSLLDSNSSDTGHEVFGVNGELGTETKRVFEFLNNCELNKQQTHLACDTISRTNILEPWPIKIAMSKESDSTTIEGLFRINEDGFNRLDADSLLLLRENGGLSIVFAQLFSMINLAQLGKRAEYLEARNQTGNNKPDDLNSILDDGGSLNFDAISLDQE